MSPRRVLHKESFRGWTIPGPVPPGALGKGPEVEEGESLDSISGHFRLFQLKKGHRFSTDDLLVAWYGSSWCAGAKTALDLGSGLGTVSSIVAWRMQGIRLTTVEAQDESFRLAKKSAKWNGLSDRIELRHGDFREEGVIREDERFDLITGSPPYFPPGSGVEGDHPQKIACRFEMRGDVLDYCRAGAGHLSPGGVLALVFPVNPVEQLERVREGARESGLSIVRMRSVVFREGNRRCWDSSP